MRFSVALYQNLTQWVVNQSQRWFLLALILASAALRFWALNGKGLSYDEAATALMARATPGEIIQFHWTAAFEHPPIWQLLMHAWSLAAGQSETALRWLPALAGVLLTPLLWQLLRRVWRDEPTALLGAALVTLSPSLLLYSQEARMYTLVVALALALIALALRLPAHVTWVNGFSFVLLAWCMLGLHYYSALAIAVIALYWLTTLRRQRRTQRWLALALILLAALLPVGLWLALAPGVRDTLAVVSQFAAGGRPSAATFFHELWRELAFGAVRWLPAQALSSYLLLPVASIGLVMGVRRAAGGWLVAALVLVPIVLSGLLFGALATRYILFIWPLLLGCAALAITSLWRWRQVAGIAAAVLTITPLLLGLAHYATSYVKSDYRAMAAFLLAQATAADLVLLEGPRQHLLYKYYVTQPLASQPVPAIELPAYWPVNALPVVPEETDDQLQAALANHAVVWLALTAEDEVDRGEFVAKYLRAVAYRDFCRDWLDVHLCRFRSPHFLSLQPVQTEAVHFTGDFWLDRVLIGAALVRSDGVRYLPVEFDWRAEAQPVLDYKLSLRLVDGSGAVVAQTDDFPIGPLLPPTTWAAGDEKPGYFVLEIPAQVAAAGVLQMTAALYDGASGAPVAAARAGVALPSPMVLTTIDGATLFPETP